MVAKFVPAITITLDGRSVAGGTGTVALDHGTSCNAVCRASALVPQGSRIRLSASPAWASQVRWISGCSGAELGCELTANADISATALFNGANYVFRISCTNMMTMKSIPSRPCASTNAAPIGPTFADA